MGPVLVVGIVLAALIALRLNTYAGNVTGFIRFGQQYVRYTIPPRGAVIDTPQGYDGQFFWLQAGDPLVLSDATVARFRGSGQAFRMQRMAYPTVAYVLAGGQRDAIEYSLLAVNVIVVLASTAAFAAYAAGRGWSPRWAIAVGLMPGFLLPTVRDLSDPLACATMVAGLLAWRGGRRGWAAALLTVAVLAREPVLLAVAAIAIESGFSWWRARAEPGALARTVRATWPAVAVPVLAFALWQAYIDARYGGNTAATSGGSFMAPVVSVVDEIRAALDRTAPFRAAFDVAYLGLMVAAIAGALATLRRRRTAVNWAAALFALSLLVLTFGDDWSYTRLSAPLLALLLVDGLENRSRLGPTLCLVAPAMILPLAFGS